VAHDPTLNEISLNTWAMGAHYSDQTRAVAKFKRQLKSFTETFEDLPRALRGDAALRESIERAEDYLMDDQGSVGWALDRASKVMDAARAAVTRARDPMLRHSAPLARAARAYGELIRCATNVRAARDRADAMRRLGA